jgi:hypothetical protein
MILERGMLQDGRRFAVIEELATVCPLGIRFWDAVNDVQIRDRLRVTAWPLPARRPITRAFRTVSDIYAFQGLPGLIDVEMPPSPPAPVPSPPAVRPFVVEVRDESRRFLPVAFRVDLPLPSHRLYLSPLPGSPSIAVPGFYLFSSPVRERQPQVAVVRTELFDDDLQAPAAWALVRVTIAGQGDRWGLADEAGRVAVQFPLPLLTPGFGELFVSPPPIGPSSPPGPPVADRSWAVSIAVFSEPSRLAPLPGTDLPDLAEVFQQAPADLFQSDASPLVTVTDWTGTLGWDGELFAATDGRRQLRMTSHGSP